MVLVGLGILFLVQQTLGFDIGHFGWPLFVLLPGLAFLAAYALGPRGSAGMAWPGCVLHTIGLILAIPNAFNLWWPWAHSCALTIYPVVLGSNLLSAH